MAKASIARPRPARKQPSPIPRPPKGLTLADIRVVHQVGPKATVRDGETLVRLIEATRHQHDDSDTDLDFINPYAIAIELDGIADVLCGLSEVEEYGLQRALPCVGEQLRRLGHRVTALATRSGVNSPAWYRVEVKK